MKFIWILLHICSKLLHDANKATGPNNIPRCLSKIAAEVIAPPTLTPISNKSLSTGIYQGD